MYYPDMSLYRGAEKFYRVGWLDRDKPFATGEVEPAFFQKLVAIRKREAVNAVRGWYYCPFCKEHAHPIREDEGEGTTGHAQIWVPDLDGQSIFIAPDLILHYIKVHQYRPPASFLNALTNFDINSSWKGQHINDTALAKILYGSTDLYLYKQYVGPIYLQLLGASILRASELEQQQFKEKFAAVCHDANDEVMSGLLADSNWRCSLVGAWVALVYAKVALTDAMGKMLLQGKDGTIGYLYALASFGTPDAAKYITDYLTRQLSFKPSEVRGTDMPHEPRFQDIALCALLYIDRTKDTEYTAEILKPDGLWDRFINFQYLGARKLSDNKPWNDYETTYNDFCQMIKFVREAAGPAMLAS